MAAVARDEAHNFLGASALVMKGITDPEMAEAMACREGMVLASDLVLQKFKLASDCLNVVRNLRNRNGSLWTYYSRNQVKCGGFH